MALNAEKSQEFVPIKEVRDGIVILKDGGYRAILLASSINLSLKSSEEQSAVISQFQTFLNSLDFTVEIVVQSRRLDIRPYLLTLEERMKEQTEQLLKIQTKEYIDFIRSFTDEVNIMTKSFFIVVPYDQIALQASQDIFDRLTGSKKSNSGQKELTKDEDKIAEFEERRTQLDQRVGVVVSGLSGLGIRTSQLKTEEVVELFYKTFNPGDISQGMKLDQ